MSFEPDICIEENFVGSDIVIDVFPGAPGPDGDDGAQGSLWRVGAGAPDNATGLDGDLWLDNTTNNVYQRQVGIYVVIANIGAVQAFRTFEVTDAAPVQLLPGYNGIANTSATPLTLLMPASPTDGMEVAVKDESATAGTYPLTVQGVIDGDSDGDVIATDKGGATYKYRSALTMWVVKL